MTEVNGYADIDLLTGVLRDRRWFYQPKTPRSVQIKRLSEKKGSIFAYRMLQLYISHAPADRKTLEKLLVWLRPLEEKYFLKIWYDTGYPALPPFPPAWQLLLFWYKPPKPEFPYHPELPAKAADAHIYLFLTSHASLITAYIDQIEVTTAVDRYVHLGEDLVRVFPVLVSPSVWQKHSRLSGFKVLGPPASLAAIVPQEEGYKQLVEQLEPAIVELRQNWIEEYRRAGLSTEGFFRPPEKEIPNTGITPLPGWAGWVILFGIIYVVTAWYTNYCAPRMYHGIRREIPIREEQPEMYRRERPYRPADTTGLPLQDEPDAPLRPTRYRETQ